MEIKPVAYFRSPLREKFGTPRQSGLVPGLEGVIEFCGAFDSAMLDGLEEYDWIWLIWGFSLNKAGSGGAAKVRPPRLGGNRKAGVYATRSPYRPNPLGLSSVRVLSIDRTAGKIMVEGADLVDGTPIFDIKPYLEYTDAHTGIRNGFTDSHEWAKLRVEWPRELDGIPDRETIAAILSNDPRPAYQNDPERVYGLSFNGRNIRFRVEGDIVKVVSAEAEPIMP